MLLNLIIMFPLHSTPNVALSTLEFSGASLETAYHDLDLYPALSPTNITMTPTEQRHANVGTDHTGARVRFGACSLFIDDMVSTKM